MGLKLPAGIKKLVAYRKRPTVELKLGGKVNRGIEVGFQHAPLFLLYAIVLYFCVSTAGNPYAAALAAQNQAIEVAKQEKWDNFDQDVDTSLIDGKKKQLNLDKLDPNSFEAKEAKRKEREARAAEKERIMAEDPFAMFKGKDGMFPSWFADDEEEDQNREAMPSEFLPDFWPTFSLVFVCVLNLLFSLAQHWSVDVKCAVGYESLSRIENNCFLKVVPQDSRAAVEIVQVTRSKEQDQSCLLFTYQKQRYKIEDDESVNKIEAEVDLPLKHYLHWKGHNSDSTAPLYELYGENKFEVHMPDFLELYLNQIASPMSVFQLLCQGLWLLDEAWSYALYGLFSILFMEGTSVFSRLKHIKSIRGMGNKACNVWVRRSGQWLEISTERLLPGDLVSVKPRDESDGDVVPCDCLLLKGSAVVNEATLTGESVPQMKESVPLDSSEFERQLDIQSLDKIHVLFGGTSLMQHKASASEEAGSRNSSSNDSTPDGGCLCYVLRTGFSSSQGHLVRMIEFSSSGNNRSSGDAVHMKESLLLISMLLVFAVSASSYVLYMAMTGQDGSAKPRTRYQLLIRCIIIVTSVVPSDLPMQLALAVNVSLMQLMKQQVFCTEPFRVPVAGKIDACFFDKTGTVTTDQLEAVGYVSADMLGSRRDQDMAPMKTASAELCRVVAGCHSLLDLNGKLMGDPIEIAAMQAICWDYSANTQTSYPVFGPRETHDSLCDEIETDATKRKRKEREDRKKARETEWIACRAWGKDTQSVKILHRYHFASALARMSVIAQVTEANKPPRKFVLTKGSPEALFPLLCRRYRNYEAGYTKLVKQGSRVIALACKDITDECKGLSDKKIGALQRDWAERELTFVGFVAFKCLMRSDSKKVISDLASSGHTVSMITGDNMLTAIHVACKTAFTTHDTSDHVLILESGQNAEEDLHWVNAEDGSVVPFSYSEMDLLAEQNDLCVSGKSLRVFLTKYSRESSVASKLKLVKVFARMAPSDKEEVLSTLNSQGHTTLMCGDGANDVGALKAAHVGVALLGGFGSLNTEKSLEVADQNVQKLKQKVAEIDEEFNKTDEQIGQMGFFERVDFERRKATAVAAHAAEVNKERKDKGNQHKADSREIMMKKVEMEVNRLVAQGEGQLMASAKAFKNVMAKEQEANRARMQKAGGGFTASAAAMAAANDGLGEDALDAGALPMIKLGDASVAAPFTSKKPSIQSVHDIIRQGRCTLVSRVQNNQIICLTCLISSYSLSVLYLEGVKFSDYQLTLSGVLLTTCHLALSYSTPLTKISAARPPDSMFHPALFLSLVGQFAVHLCVMWFSVAEAKTYLPEGFKQEMVGRFSPSLVNTVVFLVQTMQQVSVLMVNYKGRPFQPGLSESKALLNALGLCFLGLLVCGYEVFPAFNKGIGMVKLPSDALRLTVMKALLIDAVGTFVWDRLCVRIFAPDIHKAISNTQYNAYELFVVFRKLAVTAGTMYILVADGSIISLGVIWFFYKNGWY